MGRLCFFVFSVFAIKLEPLLEILISPKHKTTHTPLKEKINLFIMVSKTLILSLFAVGAFARPTEQADQDSPKAPKAGGLVSSTRMAEASTNMI